MGMVAGAVLILALKLCCYYLLGNRITDIILKNKNSRLAFKVVSGFLVYQILFQLVALIFVVAKQSLTRLAFCFGGLLVALLIVCILYDRKRITEDGRQLLSYVRTNRATVLLMCVVVVFVCYFAAINGETNEDSRYYIGFINTTLTTDSMYRYNVYTGLELNSFYLRRALATFDIHSAVVCRVFGIHPLVETRIIRACLNAILTGMTAYLIGTELFAKKKETDKYAGRFVAFFYGIYFVFAETIYTSATFLLYRGYEGKAFSANVLLLLLAYCYLRILRGEKQFLLFLGLGFWAGVAVSSSAIAVSGIFIFLITATWLAEKVLQKVMEKKYGKC